MFPPRAWHGRPQRLMVYFILLLLLPAGTVVWLGVRLIRQDRDLETRQIREHRDSAADLLVAGLEQGISATERHLDGRPDRMRFEPGDDAVAVMFRNGEIEAFPKGLLYYPPKRNDAEKDTGEFTEVEKVEFRAQDYKKAAGIFRSLGRSSNPSIRANALIGLARNLRKLGRANEALRVYGDLFSFDSILVGGLPADLAGRHARCVVLREIGREDELRNEAHSLEIDLLAGRWRLDRGTFQEYVAELESWLGEKVIVPSDRTALAEAVHWMWLEKETGHRNVLTTGRQLLKFGTIYVAVLWQSPLPQGDGFVALIAGPKFQQREWFGPLQDQATSRGFRMTFAAADGSALSGEMPGGMASILRPTQTNLPWTILVSNANVAADFDDFAHRRRMLLSSLSVLTLLVIAGGYFVLRAVSREFVLAQLQDDFVSAVSHEFRTPLTSLQQYTDLLTESDDLPPEKRKSFYQAQTRATQRLHRLVESLLEFRRIEAGMRRYRREDVSVESLVRRVVEDFRLEAPAKGFIIETEINESGVRINADPEAFALALWNLLDNAVKYSGDSRTIGVCLAPENGRVAISVRDSGLGIPRQEQSEIFRKFVRGAEARHRGIKGMGIGLATVQLIVKEHAGAMRLQSVPGIGSTFTMLLPRKD